MKPTFFKSPSNFRKWLGTHHSTKTELLVGFYKKSSGKPSITWPESVDQALCFGWIDGIRRTIDDISYTIRFTPRKSISNWSNVNINRVQELIELGLMKPAGLKAFQARREYRSGIYAYEQRSADLPEQYEKVLKKNKRAWTFFQTLSAAYRKQIFWWIVSAKREETRLKRLQEVIDASAKERRVHE